MPYRWSSVLSRAGRLLTTRSTCSSCCSSASHTPANVTDTTGTRALGLATQPSTFQVGPGGCRGRVGDSEGGSGTLDEVGQERGRQVWLNASSNRRHLPTAYPAGQSSASSLPEPPPPAWQRLAAAPARPRQPPSPAAVGRGPGLPAPHSMPRGRRSQSTAPHRPRTSAAGPGPRLGLPDTPPRASRLGSEG